MRVRVELVEPVASVELIPLVEGLCVDGVVSEGPVEVNVMVVCEVDTVTLDISLEIVPGVDELAGGVLDEPVPEE